ncbi:MAG TPA: hypothetical protein DD385_08185 [Marinobacter sp.]|nr:hypothetical protein [Marinobacter sp.]
MIDPEVMKGHSRLFICTGTTEIHPSDHLSFESDIRVREPRNASFSRYSANQNRILVKFHITGDIHNCVEVCIVLELKISIDNQQ